MLFHHNVRLYRMFNTHILIRDIYKTRTLLIMTLVVSSLSFENNGDH